LTCGGFAYAYFPFSLVENSQGRIGVILSTPVSNPYYAAKVRLGYAYFPFSLIENSQGSIGFILSTPVSNAQNAAKVQQG
jgi:hypothetical protein